MSYHAIIRPLITVAAAALLAPAATAGQSVTYAKDIAPILQEHCQECHQPKGIAPFALMDYDDARGWSRMIKEVVSEGRMPPWYAEPNHLEFANDISLTKSEKEMIISWVDAGAPRGDKADMPEPRTFESGWRMGKPDKIFTQPEEIKVPAEGVLDYQYLVSDPGFEEDVWLTAMECMPGNPKVVHHIIMYAIPPGVNYWELDEIFESFDEKQRTDPMSREAFQDWGSLFIAGYAPGMPPVVLTDGVARRIPAGTKFLWELHYTPTGKPETDRSYFGVKFAKEPVKKEYLTATPSNTEFLIPAHDSNYYVDKEVIIPEDLYIHAFTPHMHFRGKDFKYTLHYPDGRKEVPLYVPNYDFNWQITYHLKEPLFVPKGTKLHCEAHFDNSADNPQNPDPTRAVDFGEQSFDEMMIGFLDFTWAENEKTASAGE